jgi:hypothetical protein
MIGTASSGLLQRSDDRRISVLNALIGREDAIRSRVLSELAEIEAWLIEDGYEPSSAKIMARKQHPYFVQRKWRRSRKDRGL